MENLKEILTVAENISLKMELEDYRVKVAVLQDELDKAQKFINLCVTTYNEIKTKHG